MRGMLSSGSYRPVFSGHETFPLRQLWLRKAFDAAQDNANGSRKTSPFVSDDAIAQLGVGKNMVNAIRHWAMACRVIDDQDRPTELGKLLLGTQGLDRFCEHPATPWLVHWHLAGDGHRSTTWYWLFNHISQQTFDAETILESLRDYAAERKVRGAASTLKRDIECCLRSYVPRVGQESPEDVTDCVLGELGLLHARGKTYEFRRGRKPSLPDGMFGYALLDYWSRHGKAATTLSFDRIAHEYGSPGRVFKLDENAVADRLANLPKLSRNRLLWTETAGMRQVVYRAKEPLDSAKLKLLETAYA
jgi:hypothetical protein